MSAGLLGQSLSARRSFVAAMVSRAERELVAIGLPLNTILNAVQVDLLPNDVCAFCRVRPEYRPAWDAADTRARDLLDLVAWGLAYERTLSERVLAGFEGCHARTYGRDMHLSAKGRAGGVASGKSRAGDKVDRNAVIWARYAAGEKVAVLAKLHKLSERQVERILAKQRENSV